jgi:general secretion pathway protein I
VTDRGTRGRGDTGTGKAKTPQSAIRNPQSRGFTLLEVMLAVAIMALVLVSLLGLQSRSSKDVELAEHITTATLLAKQVMTETLLVKPLPLLEKEGEFDDEEFADYTWMKIVVPTPVPQVLEVRVAVLWKEGDRQEQVELVSYE